MKKFNTLNVVTTAMLTAVAVIAARMFHHLGGGTLSTLFSPMHFPILIAGLLCGPYLGLIGGLLTPVLSFLISGLPPFPNGLVPMIFELGAYGFFAGLFRSLLIKNNRVSRFSSVIAIAVSMIIGRALNAVAGAILISVTAGTPFFVNLWTKFLGNFTSTWLGIILQLVLIPALLLALKKGGILVKYTDDKPEQTVQQTSEVH